MGLLKNGFVCACVVSLSGLACGGASADVGTKFTYQGRLQDAGVNFNGVARITVTLYESAVGGVAICSQSFNPVNVENGLFTIEVKDCSGEDLGSTNRWMEISITTSAGTSTLSPRQELTSAPYAAQTRGLFVDDSGNVAIGTDAPSAKLDLQGLARFQLGDPNVGPSVYIENTPTHGLVVENDGRTGLAGFGVTGAGVLDGFQLNSFETSGGSSRFVTASGLASNNSGGFMGVYAPYDGTPFAMVQMLSDADGDVTNATGAGQLSLRSTNGGPGGQLLVQNDDGPATIELLGGGSGQTGRLEMLTMSGGTSAEIETLSEGASLQLRDEAGSLANVTLQADVGGTGAFVLIEGSDGTRTLWDGDSAEGGSLLVSGSSTFVRVRPNDTTPNDQVVLPNDSVGSTEILDEPGVAETVDSGVADQITGTTVQSVGSVTIDCPGPGYVVVIGTAQYSYGHVNGSPSTFNIGVSDTATTLPTNQDFAIQTTSFAASGQRGGIATVHGVFAAGPGLNTYYLNANKTTVTSPTMVINDEQLTALFVPTAYGSAARGGSLDLPDSQQFGSAGLSPAQIRAEQESAAMANILRQQRELAEQRAAMVTMRAEMERVLAEQASMQQEIARLRTVGTAGAVRPRE